MGKTFRVAAIAAVMLAPATVWAQSDTQPATQEIAIWAYPSAENFCPAGLQPVIVGGAICCGKPTHTGYQSHPPARRRTTTPPPYIAYGKGFEDDGTGN